MGAGQKSQALSEVTYSCNGSFRKQDGQPWGITKRDVLVTAKPNLSTLSHPLMVPTGNQFYFLGYQPHGKSRPRIFATAQILSSH